MIDYPKISVVTITYGHENFIEQTLDGVFMQDYKGEIEFIISNDHSPDATDKVVKDYFSVMEIPTNFTIKYTRHEKNKGMMPNFIWALEQASGKYIALCEGDDYWIDPQKLQKQVDFLEENKEVGLIYTDVDNYDVTNNQWIKAIFKSKVGNRCTTFEEHLEKKGYLAPLTWVFRNSLLKSFITVSQESADPSFEFILIAFKITKIHYLDEVTGVHNLIQNSATIHTSEQSRYKYLKGLFKIQRSYLNKYNTDQKLKDRIYFSNYLQLIMNAKKLGDQEFFTEAKAYLLKKGQPDTKKERLRYIKKTLDLQKENAIETYNIGEKSISDFLQTEILKAVPFSKFNLWFIVYKFRRHYNLK